MTLDALPLVGNEDARAVRGYSSGADVVVLGDAPAGGPAPLEVVAPPGALTRAGGQVAQQLSALATVLEASAAVPVAVVAADLDLSEVALLDLLDRPGVRTAALVADPALVASGRDRVACARVGRDRRLVESASTRLHVVTRPTHVLPGVLRIAPQDRAEAARLLRAAASLATDAWGADDVVAVVVLVLVRGGLPVQASPLGPHDWTRGGIQATGATGGPWRQRLRGASRGGDGFFSTYAVRPVSRRLTAVGLARGWAPNAVTVVSLALGLVAAALVATGAWWAWVVAAIVLLAALVVDCVDGEIARFTRRFSALGAFLDAVGDRVKEYSVLAAVAAVAVRQGDPGWPVALAAMAVVTVRHLEDYAYENRLSFGRTSTPDLLGLEARRDLGPAEARTTLPSPPGRRQQTVHWVKKVIHMPIAERYLLISVTLVIGKPMLVLWALTVAVGVAVVWTQGGRVAAVLLGRDATWAAVPRPATPGTLDAQLDLGPLARAASRVASSSFAVGAAGVLLLVTLVPWALWTRHAGWALLVAVPGFALVGLGWKPPLYAPLAWQAPAALWIVEVLAVGLVVHRTVDVMSAAGFAFLAVVAYHRYDVVYRLRDTGLPPARWVADASLGTDGRVLLVLAVAAVAPDGVVPVLWCGTVALAVIFAGESVAGWRSWIGSQRQAPAPVRAPGGTP